MEYQSKYLVDKVNEYDRRINDVANGEAVQHVVAQVKEMKEKLVDLEDESAKKVKIFIRDQFGI